MISADDPPVERVIAVRFSAIARSVMISAIENSLLAKMSEDVSVL